MKREPVIEIEHLVTRFGDTVLHDDISLTIERGEVFAIAGASGCGKSTLLREMVMLMPPHAVASVSWDKISRA